jgi:hypothetical protein
MRDLGGRRLTLAIGKQVQFFLLAQSGLRGKENR